jgi:hypothetical protein
LTRGDNPSGHDIRTHVKEANIVLLVKGETEEDLGWGIEILYIVIWDLFRV